MPVSPVFQACLIKLCEPALAAPTGFYLSINVYPPVLYSGLRLDGLNVMPGTTPFFFGNREIRVSEIIDRWLDPVFGEFLFMQLLASEKVRCSVNSMNSF